MKNKENIIKNLKEVKLVIGNGFDLQCRLNTSYKDYFNYNKETYNDIGKRINNFKRNVENYMNFKISNQKDFWVNFDNFDKRNIWDFFFFLNSEIDNSNSKNWLWCDIEKEMLDWFMDAKSNNRYSKQNWELVYKVLSDDCYKCFIDDKTYILAAIAFKKNGEVKFSSKESFYIFLLEQLKKFETNFGVYIYKLHYHKLDSSHDVVETYTNFKKSSRNLINALCNVNNLISIDSFNYDDLENPSLNEILYNINGDYYNPIFGIDSNEFSASDIRYIFSKTSRRMEIDMLNNSTINYDELKNIVIYGHSLNEADYSYFFSLFDKIKIDDPSIDSKIVFAFSIYDKNKEESIKMNIRTAIFKIFEEYSKYKGKKEQPNRLLDYLTSQGKILMYEISC